MCCNSKQQPTHVNRRGAAVAEAVGSALFVLLDNVCSTPPRGDDGWGAADGLLGSAPTGVWMRTADRTDKTRWCRSGFNDHKDVI